MKKLTPVFLLLFCLKVRSQEKESFYVFDENWKPTKIQPASFFLHMHVVNDSCWQWDFYNYMGPLLKTEQYGDKEGKELDGVCHYYNQNGFLDSMTTYRMGKKNGDSWRLIGDSMKIRMKYRFVNDSLVEVMDDSKVKKDTARAYSDEKESEFPGGKWAWLHYLKEKFEYPERAQNASITGQVDVQFIVDKNGNVISPFISRSVEYSLDEEALKIIMNSGKWKAAFQNGHNVKSYKLQPIVFRM
jgi:protein TonB